MKQGDLNAQSGIGGYKNLTFKGKMIGMKGAPIAENKTS